MKKRSLFRTIAAMLALVMVLGMMPLGVLADEATEEAATASESQYILYEENFDSYEGRFDLSDGNNFLGAGAGWIYSKKSTNGYAYIENGKLHFAGSAYDVLYRDGGQTWGNYTVEADITYNTDNKGWAGLAYNIQSDTKWQKASIGTNGSVGLNGYDATYGSWTNNDSELNKTTLTELGLNNSFASGQMRFKVSVNNTSASLWIAQYSDGVLGNWIRAKEISNIYEDAQTGSIGFMSSNGSLGSIVVDNIKVYSDSLVSFTEDFSEYEGVNLSAGDNGGADGMGIYFYQGNNKAPSYVKDGRLYIDASSVNANYEHVYFTAGLNWTDYTVEMDVGTSADWVGMIYRASNPSFFQKTGVTLAGATSLYGYTAPGKWQHNGTTNKGTTTIKPAANEPIRLKVEVSGQSAKLYAALYNADGTLNPYTQVLSADNLYAEHTSGSVGLMLKSGSKLKAWIDNVVVSRGADRMAASNTQQYLVSFVAEGKTVYSCAVNSGESVANIPAVPEKENYTGVWDHDGSNITADTTITAVYTEREYNVADIYIPNTGIVNPPTVVQSITTALPAASGRTPAVALMEIDENLNIASTGATVEDFFASCKKTTIPAFVIDSQVEAEAISAYLNGNGIIDAFVVADSENAALVKQVRKTCPTVRGAIRFESISDNSAVLRTINENLAYVAISAEPVSVETVSYFHLRQRALWCETAGTGDIYSSIAAGWSGIISADTEAVYDVYEGITARTVTGQALPIGHRGYAVTVPENTLAAFRAAMEQGCLAVETDLRISADGEIFLLHNNTLDYATDYESRTDEFTKGNVGSSYTVAELKQLNVDYKGGTYQIPTFGEALAEFADEGLVFYAHINGDINQDPQIAARLEELLEQYDAYDNVVFFIGSGEHSLYNPVDGTVTGRISFTAGDEPDLYAFTNALGCIESFITDLVPDNYQPLFYKYGEHDDWDFYYELSARGFVNFHSVSNTMNYLEGIMLTDWGVIGALTDGANLTRDYVYKIQVQDCKILVGEPIDTTYDLSKAVGITEQAACNFIQLSGTEIADGTMTAAGEAEVVFYTTVTSTTGAQYRVYSQPVTITAAEGADVVKWNITLGDDLRPNFYLQVTDGAVDSAVINISVGSDAVVSYAVSQLPKTEEGYYVVSAALAAAQMTDEIIIEIVVDGQVQQTKTYTVKQYAQTVLDDQNMSQYHSLVLEMLNYGAKAQLYFAYNTGNLANVGNEIEYPAQVPGDTLEIVKSGEVSGISYYGASLLYLNKIAVRYYFTAPNGVEGLTFKVGETTYQAAVKDGLYYVEIPGINPQEYADIISLVVSDGTTDMTIGYSPMHYITRMYNRSTTQDALKDLLQAMYGYHLAADSTVNSVATGATLLLNSGYESSDKYAVMSFNIEALTDLTYGWKNTVALGVSGNISWNNYAFQLAYGNSSEQNLVKLNNNMGYNGTDVVQEQWYNNAKLEALFADGGMDVKVIRMNTRAFLLADMGEGYELIGTMMVPADAETLFSVCNNSTAVKLSGIQVETGKEAALTALNGIDLTLSKTPHIFPIESDTWTVEGRLAVDFANMPTNDYRLFAGADGFSQAVAVLSVGGSTTNWRVQNQTTWKSYVLADTCYNLLNKDNGGMYVRWIRSGDILTLWVSADGKNWQQTQSFTGFTNDDLYILSNQNLGDQLLDVSFTTEAVFTQEKKADTMFVPGDYTSANYAVFEANIKALDAITYDWGSNIIVSPTGNTKWDSYDFQILYGGSAEKNLVKLTGATSTVDGITVNQEQWVNSPDFEKIFSEDGMNIKVVRLDTWTYLLADMGSGYEIVGKMYIPADVVTQFSVYNNNTRIEISNYSVKTGEDAALAALDGITLDVGLVASSFAIPVTSTQWTLEGKASITDFSVTDDYRLFVSSLKSEWRRMSLVYIYDQSTWKGQSVAQVAGNWGSAVIPDGNNLTGDGLWVRFARDGANLSLYVSTDRVTWTYVYACDNCGTGNSIIYIFESAEQNSTISDMSIRLGLPE